MGKNNREWERWLAQNPERVVDGSRPQAREAPAAGPYTPPLIVEAPGPLSGICLLAGISENDVRLMVQLDEVGPSFNEFYRGMNWRERKALADQWHSAVFRYIQEHQQPAIMVPVECVLLCTFRPGRQAQDGINLAPTCKMMEDALVELHLLPEDTGHWVRWHHLAGRNGQADHSTLIYYEHHGKEKSF